jgi:hypothetical protein
MADVTEFNLGVPEYDCNTMFFNVIMRNLMLIDSAIAGLEGYNALNVPILIDSLISKTGKEKRPELMKKKKEIVAVYTEGKTTKEDRNAAILEANIEVLGYVVDHLFKYLNLETKLGVMES